MAKLKYFKVKGINERNDIELHKYNQSHILNSNNFTVKSYIHEKAKEIVSIPNRELIGKIKNFLLFITGITIFKYIVLFPAFVLLSLLAAASTGMQYIFKINAYKEIRYFEDIGRWGIENYYASKENNLTRKRGYAFKVFILTLILYCITTTIGFAITGNIKNSNLFLTTLAAGSGSLVFIIPIIFACYKVTTKNMFLLDGTSIVNEIMRHPDSTVDKILIDTKNHMLKAFSGYLSYIIFSKPYSTTVYAAFKDKEKIKKDSYRNQLRDSDFWIDDYQIIRRGAQKTTGYFYTDTAMYHIDKEAYSK